MVISGIEQYLRSKDYFFLTVVHRHDPDLLSRYSHVLMQRGVEGFITVDTAIQEIPTLPTVAVAGHKKLKDVTNILLDHDRAALLGLQHLKNLGHKKIAVFKGHPVSSDAKDRWIAICEKADELGISIDPELTVQIDIEDASPQLGYPFAKQLLARRKPFTALFAFNDTSALGAIRAFQEQGLRVPEDISVLGFDDIVMAAFSTPSLTTIRQPWLEWDKLPHRSCWSASRASKTIRLKLRSSRNWSCGNRPDLRVPCRQAAFLPESSFGNFSIL